MSKTKNQRTSYFRLDTKLTQKLDRRITRSGFTSRSDFFTAVSYVALYGENAENEAQKQGENTSVQNLPEPVTEWVKTTLGDLTEEQIQTELHAVIEEMLFAVIAMKGIDVAFENTWEDVRAAFHDKTGIWATESDIREAFTAFAAIKKAELVNYREQQMQNRTP